MKVNGLMLKPIVRRQNGVPRLARPPRNLGFDLPVGLSQRNIGGIRANTYCQIVSRPGAILSTAGLVAAQWTSNAARPGSVCFYRFGECVERRPFSSARSRPRPERGQKCLGSPPWLDDHGKHPAQEVGSAIARRRRETCVFIIIGNLDPAFMHARPGTFVRVATVQAT
jgi:hypothetical protein